jgi:hypothetical protein
VRWIGVGGFDYSANDAWSCALSYMKVAEVAVVIFNQRIREVGASYIRYQLTGISGCADCRS